MNQSPLFPSASPGWTLLARGEQENDMVARCPVGHIHVDYGNFSVRFHDREFLAFARMVAEAAINLQYLTGAAPMTWPEIIKPSTTFSLN